MVLLLSFAIARHFPLLGTNKFTERNLRFKKTIIKTPNLSNRRFGRKYSCSTKSEIFKLMHQFTETKHDRTTFGSINSLRTQSDLWFDKFIETQIPPLVRSVYRELSPITGLFNSSGTKSNLWFWILSRKVITTPNLVWITNEQRDSSRQTDAN